MPALDERGRFFISLFHLPVSLPDSALLDSARSERQPALGE
ncbi:hypothetical protein [Salinicola endophyticus]|nr:hypothetical protein [Salinicola endophyticus]